MHELVADDVVGIRQRTAEREDDPAPQRFGHAAGALAQLTRNDVVLLEVSVRGVQHQRLSSAQLMAEELLKPRVPSLGKTRRDVDPFALLWIEVDVEVVGLEDLKVEALVRDFVLAEV